MPDEMVSLYSDYYAENCSSRVFVEKSVSTLFQKPGEAKEIEAPREYYSADAGFVVVIAWKDVY